MLKVCRTYFAVHFKTSFINFVTSIHHSRHAKERRGKIPWN